VWQGAVAMAVDLCKGLLARCLLLFIVAAHSPSFAHTPQDAIDALQISPDYENDATVFVIVQNYLLRSDNRGASWKQLVSGLDSQHVYSDITVSLQFQDDETLFVSTDGGGIYRSTDKGDSWHRFNDGLRQLKIGKVFVAGPNALLAAGSERGLFVSDVQQGSWRRVLSDDVQITAMASVQRDGASVILAADSEGGIWSPESDLSNWQRHTRLDDVGAITSLAYRTDSEGNPGIYIGTETAGLLRAQGKGSAPEMLSTDWPDKLSDCRGRPLDDSQPDRHVRDIEVMVNPDGSEVVYATTWNSAVYESRDTGDTWQLLNDGITCDNQADSYSEGVPHYRDVEMSPRPGGDLFLAGFDGLYRSVDGGQSWVQFETLPVYLIRGMDVSAADGDQHGLAVTTYGGGAYISTDLGESWIIANHGLVTTRLADIEFSTAFPSDSRIFGLSKERFLVRPGPEAKWDPNFIVYMGWRRIVGANLERRLKFSPDFGTRLFLSDAERRRVWPMQIELSPKFSADETILIGLRSHGVWKSTDAGETWNRDWAGPTGFVTALQISPDYDNDQTAFVAMRRSGIYVTRDGARSWHPANMGFRFYAKDKATESPNYYIDPPLRSAVNDVLMAISPDFAADQTIFASSVAGLFRSQDAGRSWSQLTVNPSLSDVPVNAIGISPSFGEDGVVVASLKGQGLYRSNDGGATFESIGQDLLSKNLDLKLIEFSPRFALDNTIYAEDYRGEDRGPIQFDGDWSRTSGARYSASTQTIASKPGAAAVLNFIGREIRWFGERGPEAGHATVSIDGSVVAQVDLYSPDADAQSTIFSVSDLDKGPHQIRIEVLQGKNPSSTGHRVAVDGFDVAGF
jgi:photosystem II stability/assembly factor-like uncharacterized protein